MKRTANSRRWLAVRFLCWRLECALGGHNHELPVAMVSQKGRLLEVNSAAIQAGLAPGMVVNQALDIYPMLTIVEAPAAPVFDRRKLASHVFTLSPEAYWLSDDTLVANASGTERLWGQGQACKAFLHQLFLSWPWSVRWAMAPSPYAAWCFVENLAQDCQCESVEQQRRLLSGLPVKALCCFDECWPPKLQAVGIQTLEQFFRFSDAELTALLGKQTAMLRHALWQDSPLRHGKRIEPLTDFKQEKWWDDAIVEQSALLFRLRPLLQQLFEFCRTRRLRPCQICLVLMHHKGQSEICLKGAASLAAPRQWLVLLQLKLASRTLPPVIGAQLHCRWFAPADTGSADLFGHTPRMQPEWLLARLQARLGQQAVFFLQPQATHRPEAQSRIRYQPVPIGDALPSVLGAPRPLWLLPDPQPTARNQWQQLHQCHWIQTDWWTETPCERVYFRAQDRFGRQGWIFRDRAGAWYLHGLWE